MDEEGHRQRVSEGTEEQEGLICRIFSTSFIEFPPRMRVRAAVESRMGINWGKSFNGQVFSTHK